MSKEQLDALAIKQFDDLQLRGVQNRQRYLESTDWYVLRQVEQDILIPQAILDERQNARDEISELRIATIYEEIGHLPTKFS